MVKKLMLKKLIAPLIAVFLGVIIPVAQVFALPADVPQNYKFRRDIEHLEDSRIINPDEPFNFEKPVTREVFAKWIIENTGLRLDDYKKKKRARMKDVPIKDNEYAPYIYRIIDLGVLDFDEKRKPFHFQPKKPLTRIEALQWLFLAEGMPVPKVFSEDEYQATDVSADSEIAPVIHKAIQLGILNPGKVKPYQKLKRGEAAHFLRVVRSSIPTLTVTILPTSGSSDFTSNPKYEVLTTTWERILNTYLRRKDVNRENLIYAAIEGMVKELDDTYSNFERPGKNALLEQLSGEIQGIGIVIQEKDDGDIIIISPIIGSPADRAGLLPGDIIVEVDGVSTKKMKLTEVSNLIKGPKGTQVKITVLREGKKMDFTITRDVIKIVSAGGKRTDDNIMVVTLSDFGANTTPEFEKILDEIKAKKPKAIVIDLRNNPGGYLDTAIQIAGHFIKNGERIAAVRYPDREEAHYSKGIGELAEYPIAVLINKGSASASEILAGALQDFAIAKIIGEKSFGKGTVQELAQFTDGSTLKLTVAEWLTPRGRSIEKNGVIPDIEVKMTDEDRKAKKDPQMDRALEELRK